MRGGGDCYSDTGIRMPAAAAGGGGTFQRGKTYAGGGSFAQSLNRRLSRWRPFARQDRGGAGGGDNGGDDGSEIGRPSAASGSRRRVELAAGGLWASRERPGRLWVRCFDGELWVTRAGGGREGAAGRGAAREDGVGRSAGDAAVSGDVILRAGESVAFAPGRKVVVQALSAARFEVEEVTR